MPTSERVPNDTAPPRLLLASASPRRRELLGLLQIPFEIAVSHYEEPLPPREPIDVAEYVQQLAVGKALDVAQRVAAGRVTLGADTLVTLDENGIGVPLGKPVDEADARRMLSHLSDRVHSVYTGVALIRSRGAGQVEPPRTLAVRTRVRFRALSERMITAYLATGEPFDKAGAYGAQGYAAPFICSIEGDFFNVIGLPLCELGRLLEDMGLC